MKKLTFFIALLLVLSTGLTACEKDNNPTQETPDNNENNESETDIKNMKLKVTIGDIVLTATLADNPTAKDFISLLPLTVKLDDYASTEKIFYTERKLSTKDAAANINAVAGDITYYSPWGNVAIFYKDFGNSSSLIRIAKFDDNIDVLKKAGSIDNVKFELQKKE